MSETESYIHLGRVLVAIQMILIPIYFYLLSFIFTTGTIWFFNSEELKFFNDLLLYIIGPIVLSIPLLFWTFGRRYQIADAYESFGRSVWNLPISIRAFYGFNFVIVLFFLIPILTPIISLFGGYFIAVYLFNWRDEDRRFNLSPRVRIFTFCFFPLPLLIVVGFFFGHGTNASGTGLLSLFIELFELLESNVDTLYTAALILADAATIGAILYFIYEGAQQVDKSINIPEIRITLLVFIIFFSLEAIYLIIEPFREYFSIFHLVMVGIGLLLVIVRLIKGLNTESNTNLKSWLFLIVFQIINFISGNTIQVIARSTAIIVAFLIFSILFFTEYRHACQRF